MFYDCRFFNFFFLILFVKLLHLFIFMTFIVNVKLIPKNQNAEYFFFVYRGKMNFVNKITKQREREIIIYIIR